MSMFRELSNSQNLASIRRAIGQDHDACGLGLVARLQHPASHAIIERALAAVAALKHRGAVGADDVSGDGVGLLCEIPHAFFAARMPLPEPGRYGVGTFFFEGPAYEADEVLGRLQEVAAKHRFRFLTRKVPVRSEVLGPMARACEPRMYQLFFLCRDKAQLSDASMHHLRLALNRAARSATRQPAYFVSMSANTLVFKAMVKAGGLSEYFLDLQDPELKSRFAIVHTRFSTNTLPNWRLIQPFSRIAHNGEFNTLKGNLAWFMADIAKAQRAGRYKQSFEDNCPPGSSDSFLFDQVLDWHVEQGKSAVHALRTMIPPAYENCPSISTVERSYFEREGLFGEPWDGPALLAFTDGRRLGAVLDRSGLRPARYSLQKDGYFYLASEDGAFPVDHDVPVRCGRLSPGEMLTVDPQTGQILFGSELNLGLASAPAVHAATTRIEALQAKALPQRYEAAVDACCFKTRNKKHALYEEEVEVVLSKMAFEGIEPLGSMGNDLPLAVLSDELRSLFDFCHQKFAQVTNPPLDAIREVAATSLTTQIGPFSTGYSDGRWEDSQSDTLALTLPSPFLNAETHAALCQRGPAQVTFDLALLDGELLADGLERLVGEVGACLEAATVPLLIVLEQTADFQSVFIPSLLATAVVHRRLTEGGLRRQATLVVIADDAWSVHHGACLIGFGADLVWPRLGCDWARHLAGNDDNYLKAMSTGLRKVMSKMGIATVQAYRGAQIFDVVGFSEDVMTSCFPMLQVLVTGVDFPAIEAGLRRRCAPLNPTFLGHGSGQYQWSPHGQARLHSPVVVTSLQRAVRFHDAGAFAEYCDEIDAQSKRVHLRGQLRIRVASDNEVAREPTAAIMRRFTTGAMSLGSISEEAHETIALAANSLAVRSNSGEGGEAFARSFPDDKGQIRKSAIRQVASGRFGVTTSYLVYADELQIKIAQGAKPGEGGQLPGHKVDQTIAALRHTLPGITLISPPPHHDIYSIEDLAQLIYDLKSVNPGAKVSVKLVSSTGVDVVAVGVAKAGADSIVISGFEGGTGASPVSSIQHAGLPWELSLNACHSLLQMSGLREQVRLQVDGGLRTPRDIVMATLLGADEFGFGTITLIALGCVMMRQCHTNRCPVGIATQDPQLRQLFPGEPQHLARFFAMVADGVSRLVASMGAKSLEGLRGRADLLELVDDPKVGWWPAATHRLQTKDWAAPSSKLHHPRFEDRYVEDALHSVRSGLEFSLSGSINNEMRSFGARLAGHLAREFGEAVPPGSVRLGLNGVAGPSFMAFATANMEARLDGSANDYVGKGLSGGRVVIRAGKNLSSLQEGFSPVVCGNVALYGATSGQLFAAGSAGERFAVRNSGALAVVEGLGDNACEYMTGGLLLNLGAIGANFGAGMSGGVAFLEPQARELSRLLNHSSVQAHACDRQDEELLRLLLRRHFEYTGSLAAKRALSQFASWALGVKKVAATDYLPHWRERVGQLISEFSAPLSLSGASREAYERSESGLSFYRSAATERRTTDPACSS